MAVDLALRCFHIIPAIFLAGGVFFMWSSLVPALQSLSADTQQSVLSVVRGKWSRVVMACTALLLVTGIVNAVREITENKFTGTPGQMYHGLVALKLLLSFAIFFITAVIGGRSPLAEKFRQRIGFWMTVNSLLLLVLLLVASTMKISERTPKLDATPTTTTAATQDESTGSQQ